jgi:hypothetical protein
MTKGYAIVNERVSGECLLLQAIKGNATTAIPFVGYAKVAQGVYGAVKVLANPLSGFVEIYEAIRSCFGSGMWRGDKMWRGDEKWKGG